MKRGPTGEYVAISTVGAEAAKAFVPRPLPPKPPLAVDPGIRDPADRARLRTAFSTTSRCFFELEEKEVRQGGLRPLDLRRENGFLPNVRVKEEMRVRVHEALQRRPVASIASLVSQSGLTTPTVTAAMTGLAKLGIARELTGRRRNRLFSYDSYLKLLQEGTEPV